MTKTILVLAANPADTQRLRLDKEVREIADGLRMAKKREGFILEQKWATRPTDVRRAMLNYEPSIVHFCGHGAGEEGIAFEDEQGQAKLISADALADFFEIFSDKVECVLLNACYSEVQAAAIAEHIPYVIGMRSAIGDEAAIEFAVAFYDAVGAGKSVEFAYKLACNAIRLTGLAGHLTPILIEKAVRVKRHRNQPITDKEIAQLIADVRPEIRKSVEEALLMLELTDNDLLLKELKDCPRLLNHLASKTEAGLSLSASSEDVQLIRYLRKEAKKSSSRAALARLETLLPDALPIIIHEFLLVGKCEFHTRWGWHIQLKLADLMIPHAEDLVIRAFGTVLSDEFRDAESLRDSFVMGLIARARQVIEDAQELDSWLKQVIGYTYNELRQAREDASERGPD